MDNGRPSFAQPQPIDTDGGPRRSRLRWLFRWAPRGAGLLVLLLLAFLGVDFAAGIRSLGHAEPKFLIPGFVVFCIGVMARTWTWVVIASALRLGYERTISHIRVYLVGMFAGIGVPQGAASLTRLAIIAADKRSVGRGVVAVGVERGVQAMVMAVLLLFSAIYLSALSTEALKWFLLGVGVVAGGVALSFLAVKFGLAISPVRPFARHRRVRKVIEEAKDGIKEARRLPRRTLASIAGVAFMAALLTVTSLFLAARSLDLGISFVVLMAAWSAVGIAGLLPISINGLGPREGIMTAAVAGAGFNSEGGVALGLLWFFMQTATRLMAGLTYFTILHQNREPIDNELGAEVANRSP